MAASKVDVTATHSSIPGFNLYKAYPGSTSVSSLKDKLYPLTGTSPSSMKLSQMRDDGAQVELQDHMLLGDLCNADGSLVVHIIDTDPTSTANTLATASCPEEAKFKLDEDKYAARTDTFRAQKKTGMIPTKKQEEQKEPENIHTGDRCQVIEKAKRRGTVRYVGLVDFASGYWIGIELDEPLGKHDGESQGKRYFQCEKSHGVFFKPEKIEVGDFPERDIMDEDV